MDSKTGIEIGVVPKTFRRLHATDARPSEGSHQIPHYIGDYVGRRVSSPNNYGVIVQFSLKKGEYEMHMIRHNAEGKKFVFPSIAVMYSFSNQI